MAVKNLFIFGDSITWGAFDRERGGWAQRLRTHLEKTLPKVYCSILGIPGDTVTGLAKRFAQETKPRFEADEENYFIFAFGANDSVYIPSTKTFQVSKEDFVSHFEEVLKQAQKDFDARAIVLLNITPAIEKTVNERYGEKDKRRYNNYVEEYNMLINEMGKKHKLPVIDVYSVYTKNGYDNLFDLDGLHPNEEGHQLIFEAVKPVIEKLL